jgi:hypothetical protein
MPLWRSRASVHHRCIANIASECHIATQSHDATERTPGSPGPGRNEEMGTPKAATSDLFNGMIVLSCGHKRGDVSVQQQQQQQQHSSTVVAWCVCVCVCVCVVDCTQHAPCQSQRRTPRTRPARRLRDRCRAVHSTRGHSHTLAAMDAKHAPRCGTHEPQTPAGAMTTGPEQGRRCSQRRP